MSASTDWRERARSFGEANPQVARELAAEASDPSVEALLDGMDALLARVGSEAVLAQAQREAIWASTLAPWLQRPQPPFVDVAFTNVAPGGRHDLPRGAQVQSVPVDGVPVYFRTLQPLLVSSLALLEASLEENVRGQQSLVLLLQSAEGVRDLPLDDLLLHVTGAHDSAASIVSWLTRSVIDVLVESPHWTSAQRLTGSAFAPVEVGNDLPQTDGPPSGVEAMQRYLHAPQTLNYVRLRGLGKLVASMPDTHQVRLRVCFDKPLPHRVRVDRETVRLHCTPAVNLLWTSGEPVGLDPLRPEALVRAPGLPPWAAVPYAITDVRVHGRHGPVASEAEHRAGLAEHEPVVRWSLQWRPAPSRDDVDAWMRFDIHPAALRLASTLTVSTRMWATQRRLAARLRPGDVRDTGAWAERGLRCMNLEVPSAYEPCPHGLALAQRLAALTALSAHPLRSLRALLRHLNVSSTVSPSLSASNRARIRAMRSLAVAPFRALLPNQSEVAGYRTQIELDESAFQGPGDVALFGDALHSILRTLAPAGYATQLTFKLLRAETEASWTHPSTLLTPTA